MTSPIDEGGKNLEEFENDICVCVCVCVEMIYCTFMLKNSYIPR